MNANHSQLAIVSHTVPPDHNGQAIVMERILSSLPADSYFFISARDLPEAGRQRLPVDYVQVAARPKRLVPSRRGIRTLAERINLRLMTHHRANVIAQAAARERSTAILTCTGDLFDLPGACLAAKQLKIPLLVYMFDWYAHQFNVSLANGASGRRLVNFARAMEPIVLQYASRVIVPNEILRDELRKRYGIQATIVRNPIGDEQPCGQPNPKSWPNSPGPARIVYTGAIYEAHFDAFRNLLQALTSLGDGWRLSVYTDQPREYLRAGGIDGPVDVFSRVPPGEIRAIQRNADVLFLPLAFESPYPDIIRTSAPAKIGDYLASETPILVHAPHDSFVTWYFKQHACGVVVDRPGPNRLAAALSDFAQDGASRARLAETGRQRARVDFSTASASSAFTTCLAQSGVSATPSRSAAEKSESPGAERVDAPLVSVIIPTFNRAQLVRDAIDSVLAQDHPNVELLVIDDGSTDDTHEVLARYGARIRYLRQENRGAAAARNHGIRLAKGRLVAFLDSDDLFLPGKLKKQVEYFANHPETVLTHCHYRNSTARFTRHVDANPLFSGDAYRRLLMACSQSPLVTPSIMVRRDALLRCGGFDESMALAEDIDLWCRVARQGPFGLVPEYLVHVRVTCERGSGASSVSLASLPGAALTVWRRILDKAFRSDPALGILFQRQALAKIYFNAWERSPRTSFGADWKLLGRALILWPFCWHDGSANKSVLGLPRRVVNWTLRRLLPPRVFVKTRRWWRDKKAIVTGLVASAFKRTPTPSLSSSDHALSTGQRRS